jgi:hypothetical protein
VRRELPRGHCWLRFDLAPETSDENIAQFFRAHDLNIPLENISHATNQALVAIPHKLVAELISEVLAGELLDGHRVVGRPFVFPPRTQ